MAPPRLKTSKCPSCAAPLHFGPGDVDVRCQYCGNTIHIERKRAPARPTGQPLPAHTLYVAPGFPIGLVVGGVAGVVGVAVLIAVVVPLFVATRVTSQLEVAGLEVAGPEVAKLKSGRVDSLPVTCGINQQLEVVGLTHQGPGPLVVMGVNCKVVIRDSQLKSDVVVKAGTNAELEVVNSTLEATGNAIVLSENGRVQLGPGSQVRADRVAVSARNNARIVLEGAKVHGGEAALKGEINMHLEATRAELSGNEAAVELKSNGELRLRETSLRAQETALRAGNNLDLEANGAALEGGELGLEAQINAKLRLKKRSRLSGGEAALRAESNLELTVDDSAVESDGVAVRGEMNARIEARGSVIRGGRLALQFSRPPRTLRLEETKLEGGQELGGARAQPERPGARPATSRPPGKAVAQPASALPRFDGAAAMRALDQAAEKAAASCRSSSGKRVRVLIDPGFSPDGLNAGARVRNPELRGTPEAACVEQVFREVRIPAFDERTRASGMMRLVELH